LFLGHAEDGFADEEAALRLSPRDPRVSWWQYYICHFHAHLAHWEQAIEWCNKSVASGNETAYPLADLAAAHDWLGHMKEAKEAAAQALKVDPNWTIQGWVDHWSDDPTFNAQLQRIVEGARKAGIPEGEQKTN
jgi:adenylate cyclase